MSFNLIDIVKIMQIDCTVQVIIIIIYIVVLIVSLDFIILIFARITDQIVIMSFMVSAVMIQIVSSYRTSFCPFNDIRGA